MQVVANIRLLGIALVLVLATAFAAVGGAHHVPSQQDLRVEAWILAGGSTDDLCGHEASAQHGCPVCHLVGSAILPDPVTAATPLRPHVASVEAARAAAPDVASARDPTLYLRGPPVLT